MSTGSSPRHPLRFAGTVAGWAALAVFFAVLLTSPFAVVLVPGVVGGLAVAVLIWWRERAAPPAGRVPDPFGGDVASTDVINMARIRVAGVGGLGLVAMALAVAVFVPRIRQTMLIGAAGGALMAVSLIAWRRRVRPRPSNSGGARTVFVSGDDASNEPTPGHTSDVKSVSRALDSAAAVHVGATVVARE